MKATVRKTFSGAEVTYGEARAFVNTRQKTLKVPTMNGRTQHHRGYVGTIQVHGTRDQSTCGHRLHVKRGAAVTCGVVMAKRMLRGNVECKGCGADIEFEAGVGWVDRTSGDEGGTYDVCSENRRGHRP